MMGRLIGFNRRADLMEHMDRPDCDPDRLRRTVRQFERINRLFSGSRRLIRKHIFSVMASEPARDYTLLDVGAGGGDIARWVVREARREGWHLRVTALEPDARLIPWLTEWVRDDPEIQPVGGGIADLSIRQSFDFVFSNHVLHHLPSADLPAFLDHCNRAARSVLVMNDLRRSGAAWLGFALYGAIVLHRSYALADGLRSIRRAYTREELAFSLTAESAQAGVHVVEAFPNRVVVLRTAC